MAKKTKISHALIDTQAIQFRDLDIQLNDIVVQSQTPQTLTQAISVNTLQAVGRDLFVTDAANVDVSFDIRDLRKKKPDVLDKIRAKCGKYWTTQNASLTWVENIKKTQVDIPVQMLPATAITETPGQPGSILETVETIGLKANTSLYNKGGRHGKRKEFNVHVNYKIIKCENSKMSNVTHTM